MDSRRGSYLQRNRRFVRSGGEIPCFFICLNYLYSFTFPFNRGIILTIGGGDMYYTITEVAEKLNLTNETIRNYIHAKELEAYKFGRNYRIEDKELERFLETRSNKKKA